MLPVEAEKLIPHRAPMRMIDELIDFDIEKSSGRARVRFGREHFAVSEGRILEAALVESMAQTLAAMQGYLARTTEADEGEDGPPLGMLTGVSNFTIYRRPQPGEELIITLTELKKLGRMRLVAGEIRNDGEIVAEGELKLYA